MDIKYPYCIEIFPKDFLLSHLRNHSQVKKNRIIYSPFQRQRLKSFVVGALAPKLVVGALAPKLVVGTLAPKFVVGALAPKSVC